MERFDVIRFSLDQWDSLCFLGSRLVPLPRVRGTHQKGDLPSVFRISIGAEPEFTVVIAGDPEMIVSCLWRTDKSAYASAIVGADVYWPLKYREGFHSVGGSVDRNV